MTRRSGFPRLVAATDDERLLGPDFAERLEALLEAGLPALLIRSSRALSDRKMLDLLGDAAGRCRQHGAELWVGDRVDLALAAGADAVQLPELGLSIAGARAVAPGLRIGRSVHGLESAREAIRMGADHLVVGTIFASATHPAADPAGVALLRSIRDALGGTAPPLLAIGGLIPERVGEAIQAGASGVVAVRALWEADDPARSVERFLEAMGGKGVDVDGGSGPACDFPQGLLD
ncbi:MAG: thiamine phosphate synthase [Gemmatimonadota bacterium]